MRGPMTAGARCSADIRCTRPSRSSHRTSSRLSPALRTGLAAPRGKSDAGMTPFRVLSLLAMTLVFAPCPLFGRQADPDHAMDSGEDSACRALLKDRDVTITLAE